MMALASSLPVPLRRRLIPYHIGRRIAGSFLGGWVFFAYLFLLAPLVVLAGASFDGAETYAFVNFPPENVTFQWYLDIPSRYYDSIGVSIMLAATTAALSVLFGVPAAFGLALLLAGVALVMLLTVRLFRAYLLMFGQRPSFGQILRTLRGA